jgi:hypothetical protein
MIAIPPRTVTGIIACFVLLFGVLMVIRVVYVGRVRGGSKKTGWLKYEVLGCFLAAVGLCVVGGAASIFGSRVVYILLSAVGAFFAMGGFMTMHLSSLRLFDGGFEQTGWLRYEVAGFGLSGIGLSLLLINDPLNLLFIDDPVRWKAAVRGWYVLLVLGLVAFAAGGMFVALGDRKLKGTSGRGSTLGMEHKGREAADKCGLCGGDLCRAGSSYSVGGHPFCGECYRTIEETK